MSIHGPISRLLLLCASLVVTVCAGALSASQATGTPPPPGVAFGITDFDTMVVDVDDNLLTSAGGHPQEARANFRLEKYFNADWTFDFPIEDMRTVITKLPPGFVGNPQVPARCPVDLLPTNQGFTPRCPPESAVGVITVYGGSTIDRTAIFNLIPERGYPAQFGFSSLGFNYVIYPELRSDGDYGVDMVVRGAPYNQHIGVDATFCRNGAENIGTQWADRWQCLPEDLSKTPFLNNPATECTDQAPVTTLSIDTWEHPGVFYSLDAVSPLITDCDTLEFEPSTDINPTMRVPDAPTGLDVEMRFPQEDNEYSQAPPALKKAVVRLPEGLSVNPSAGDGLAACSDAELRLKSKLPVTCPEASKIGTAEAKTPLLAETIEGAVYLRSQNSQDPESGEMFRLALVLENADRGISVRLPGQVRADSETGQLEAVFDNNPELPVSDIDLTIKDGPRAPLATPSDCGSKTIETELTSWGTQVAPLQNVFDMQCDGAAPAFDPTFVAGSTNPIAGKPSPVSVVVARRDGDQMLKGVERVAMPAGLLGRVSDVDLCAEADAASGTCADSARIGRVEASAGAGASPLWVPQAGKRPTGVYLTGPYKGAPYGLSIVVPAQAGPYDLGNIIVRSALHVDPMTAQVTAATEDIPRIKGGVPLRVREIRVLLDRVGFMLNPTSCTDKGIVADLRAQDGTVVSRISRFKIADCAALPFKPKLAMRLTGGKQVTTGRHPGVRAQVNQTGVGEAGIKRAKVTLPKSLALDPENAQALCEFEDGTKPDLENHCPKGSIVGRARAKTPLLERDLVGNVYFVKNVRIDAKTGNAIRTLPMLVVALRGEIAINLKGESSTTRGGKLVNTFNNVPDAPITKFNLNIAGGRNGILAVTRTRKAKINVCASRQIAETDMDGQNGRRHDFNVRMKTPCTKRQTTAAKRQAKRAAAKARR